MDEIRVFDYFHSSSSEGVKSDSNFWFHYHLYKYILKKYPDKYHFYLTIPNNPEDYALAKRKMNFDNVTLLPIKYPWSSALTRFWFDQEGIKFHEKNFDIFDVLFCNTIEVAPGLLSYFQSRGDYCALMNYCHWTPGIVSEPLKASYGNLLTAYTPELKYLATLFLGTNNYCNSKWGKKIILNDLSLFLTDEMKEFLNKNLNPLYLTSDAEEFLEYEEYAEKRENKTPIIIFNYRRSEYTGWSFLNNAIVRFIKLYPEIKFKFLFTSVGGKDMTSTGLKIPKEYILREGSLPREEYIKLMWQSDIQLGTHLGLTQYSLSFLDGMFCNLIPLFNRGIFYDEFFEKMPNFDISIYSYVDENDFIAKLHDMLVDLDTYKQKNKKIQEFFIKNWSWDALIDDWDKAFTDTSSKIRDEFETSKTENIDPKIFSRPVTFRELKTIMNLGNQRSNTMYLRKLKKVFNLYDNVSKPKIELTNYKPKKEVKLSGWV